MENTRYFWGGKKETSVLGEALPAPGRLSAAVQMLFCAAAKCWLMLPPRRWPGAWLLSTFTRTPVSTAELLTVAGGCFGTQRGFQICRNLDSVKYFAVMPCSFCCCTEQWATDTLLDFAVQQFICNTEREEGLDTIQRLTFSLFQEWHERFPLFFCSTKKQKWLVLLWS